MPLIKTPILVRVIPLQYLSAFSRPSQWIPQQGNLKSKVITTKSTQVSLTLHLHRQDRSRTKTVAILPRTSLRLMRQFAFSISSNNKAIKKEKMTLTMFQTNIISRTRSTMNLLPLPTLLPELQSTPSNGMKKTTKMVYDVFL